MKYIVYLTTNIVNNKIYIGVHETEDPEVWDYYLGCGVFSNKPKTYNNPKTPFQAAVLKYGPAKFKRKTLKIFDKLEDALDLEAWLVSQEFIERTDTYNITKGGSIPPRLNKNIYQYDLEGKYIKTWESIKEITDYFEVNKDRIRMIINDKRSFEASYWSEVYYDVLDTKEYRPSARGSIRQYTVDGILLKSFRNTTDAAQALDIDRRRITSAIYDKRQLLGYYFLKEGEKIEDYLSGRIKKEVNNKPIYCYDKTGNYLENYNNLNDLKAIKKYNKNDIKRAIKNRSLFKDYYWSYDKYKNIIEEDPEIMTTTPRKVYQYTLNNEFIREWNSISECKKEYPSVLQVLLGKRMHCKQYKFTFDKLKI